MSVFRGSIAEYPGVVVDNFTNCERGRVFFLSHCHKDHMTGLGSPAIFNTLQRRSTNLYCSEVTQSLLLKDPSFTQLAPFLKGLPMEQAVAMTLEPSAEAPPLSFTVTLLPAGHCPGSAMFFFQGGKGNVLYTGDFRLTLDETKRLRPLHCDSRVMDITSLYLDTTFCHPIATKIPTRDVSRELVVNQIDSWLSSDPSSVVHLQCGMFGYEHIFMALARKFNTKIHIATWKIKAYSELPSVVECLTEDGNSTRIHCCNFRKGVKKRGGLPCGSFTRHGRPPKVLTIKPSTMWFLSSAKTFKEPFVYMPECNFFRVLHSMHASYSELCDFISYLKPRRIVPCVVPVGDSSLSDVNARLKMLLPQSEVQAPRQHPSKINSSKTNHSTKTTYVRKNKEDVEAFDSDEGTSSDDTIDEFISSEDVSQINQRLFSKSTIDKTDSKLLGLPSMLSTRHRKMIGLPSNALVTTRVGGDCSTSETSSVKSSSGSATVGSLQQTSLELDLSEESTHNEDGAMAAAIDGTVGGEDGMKVDGGETRPTRNEADGSGCGGGCGLGLQQPSLDLSFDDSSESPSCSSEEKGKRKSELESGDSDKLTICSVGRRESEQLSIEEEEWHLTLECSSEEEKRSVVGVIESSGRTSSGCPDFSKIVGERANDMLDATPKADDSIATPPAKRRRRSRERKKKPHGEVDCTDLLTPLEGEILTTAITPRKLFHNSSSEMGTKPSEKKRKVRKSKTERDREKFKDVEVIDLTQEEEEDETRQTCSDVVKETGVTGTTKQDDVINKGKSPKQCKFSPPPPPPPHTKTDDHQSNFRVTPDSRISIPGPKVDGEADSDITFCEDDSGSYGGSPFYLPPTPGREKVNSILTRKSIAFSD